MDWIGLHSRTSGGKVKYLFIGDEAAWPSRLSRAMLALCYVRRVSGGSRLLDRSHATRYACRSRRTTRKSHIRDGIWWRAAANHQDWEGNGLGHRYASGRSHCDLRKAVQSSLPRGRRDGPCATLPNHQVKHRSGKNLVVQEAPLH